MADDVRISVGLRNHRKTKRLRRQLGAGACWSLVCLFLYAGDERWTGDLSGMTDADIEEEAAWEGDPGAFVAALLEHRFLIGEPGSRAIHDWQEHNPYAASKGQRIEKGKQAAAIRWEKKNQTKSKAVDATSMPSACHEHATTIAEQCPPAPAPAPAPTLPVEAKATVRQVAQRVAKPVSRFDDFWRVYPNKQGKQKAQDRWARDKLDGMAEEIIGHVLLMAANDDGWKRGYAPMGSTYLNQARWTDVPRGAPQQIVDKPRQRPEDAISGRQPDAQSVIAGFKPDPGKIVRPEDAAARMAELRKSLNSIEC